jgi:hypothetical protein
VGVAAGNASIRRASSPPTAETPDASHSPTLNLAAAGGQALALLR